MNPKECNMDADFNEEFEDEGQRCWRPQRASATYDVGFLAGAYECFGAVSGERTPPFCDGSHKTVKDEAANDIGEART